MSRQKFNQHFLKDESVIDDLIAASDICPDDVVLEVGAGKGDITRKLVEVARKIIAIECDKNLAPYLDSLVERYNNLEVIYGDALRMKLPKADRVVSNIPFNITEPLISRLFTEKFLSASLLVGETYGKQFASETPQTRLGLLTMAYFQVDYVQDVPRISFEPEPATDTSIITIYPHRKQDLTRNFRLYMVRCIWDQKTRSLEDALRAAISQYANGKGSTYVDTEKFVRQVKKHYVHQTTTRVDRLTNYEFIDLYEALGQVRLKKLFEGHKPRRGARSWRQDYGKYI